MHGEIRFFLLKIYPVHDIMDGIFMQFRRSLLNGEENVMIKTGPETATRKETPSTATDGRQWHKMKYNFDTCPDRRGTGCYKYDFREEFNAPEDALPLWVADMDFTSAPVIVDALKQAAEHGVYGYHGARDDYYQAVMNWYEGHFGWKSEKDWIVTTPGVVFAINLCIHAFTAPQDGVLIQQPVYYPFARSVKTNGRRLVNNPLICDGGRYRIDFADFEKKIRDEKVRLFVLCSPHNPVGRIWTEEELRRMEEICLANDVIVVSDEIHSDFVWEGHTHHILAGLDPKYQKNVITCTAPSKTFNIAGLQCSNIFIPDPDLRAAFKTALDATGYGDLNLFALAACRAAYTGGGEWLEQAKQYIWDNICMAVCFTEQNIPGVRMLRPEGTYLLWADLRELGLGARERQDLVLHRAKVWLDRGEMFGPEGAGFERINAACPRPMLEQALQQLAAAVSSLGL